MSNFEKELKHYEELHLPYDIMNDIKTDINSACNSVGIQSINTYNDIPSRIKNLKNTHKRWAEGTKGIEQSDRRNINCDITKMGINFIPTLILFFCGYGITRYNSGGTYICYRDGKINYIHYHSVGSSSYGPYDGRQGARQDAMVSFESAKMKDNNLLLFTSDGLTSSHYVTATVAKAISWIAFE